MSETMIRNDDKYFAPPVRRGEKEHGNKFAFVNLSNGYHLNSSKQIRTIRQHAMKDVGKSRRKLKKITSFDLDIDVCQPQPTWWLSGRWTTLSNFASHMTLPIGVHLESDSRGRQLLSTAIYRLNKVMTGFGEGANGGARIHLGDAWFTLGLRYAPTMFQILANSALYETMARSGTRKAVESYDSMRFLAKTLSSLQIGLQTKKTKFLEDAISTITGLLVYEELRGNRNMWNMHFQGLRRLVNQMGGIAALEQNEELRVTISWSELRGACVFDNPPCYPSPRQWDKYAVLPLASANMGTANMGTNLDRMSWIWSPLSPIQYSDWLYAYEIVAVFSSSAFGPPMHQDQAMSICNKDDCGARINPVVHTFLSWRPPVDSACAGSLMQEACRLGMLLYLNHVRRFLGIVPSYTDIVAGKLKDHLTANHDCLMGDWVGNAWIMQIWVLYMAGFGLQGEPNEAWFFCALGVSLKRHGLSDWCDVLKLMKSVLWFEEVFGGPNDERVRTGSMW